MPNDALEKLVKQGDADRLAGWLAEVLCAKLCHDLAGMVGAVSTGAELLSEEGVASPMAVEALDLMASSAASLAVRLRFLRLALGPANPGAATQARSLADAYYQKGFPQGDWRLDWPTDAALAGSGEQVKLLLNLICVAQECLPRGGIILVSPGSEGLITATGSAVQIGEAALGLTEPDPARLPPRAAQGAYAALLARRLGLFIQIQPVDGGIRFVVKR